MPADGLSGFPIVENELTGVRALFDPDDRMVHNKPHGYKIKPTVQAELFDPNPAAHGPGVLIDHITFIAKPGVTTAQVEALAATAGATVVIVPTLTRWYRLKLPVTMDLQTALVYFPALPEADIVLPAVNYALDAPPAEGSQPSQDLAGIPAAWELAQTRDPDGFVGSHAIRVAVAEGAIDVTHPDLRRNIGINQGELPFLLFETNLIAGIQQDEIDVHDCDPPGSPDGIITIWDMECDEDIAPPDFNDNGVIDAQDIAHDDDDIRCTTTGCWKDGIDDDGNRKDDDTVGWNFTNNTNDPSLPVQAAFGSKNGVHATMVAGIIGAEANNGNAAGLNWRVSIVPLATTTLVDDVLAPHEYFAEAFAYADNPKNRIDVFNMSVGALIELKDAERGCGDTEAAEVVTGIPEEEFDAGVTAYNAAFRALFDEDGRTLYVLSAGNTSHDITHESVYRVPFKAMRDVDGVTARVMAIGAAESLSTKANSSNYGEGVTVFAPGGAWRILIPSQYTCKAQVSTPNPGSEVACLPGCTLDGSNSMCEITGGTSAAAPTVAGAAALLAAADPLMRYNGVALRTALINASLPAPFADCNDDAIVNARLIRVDLLLAQ